MANIIPFTQELYDNGGVPITGGAAFTYIKFRRTSDGYLLDWDDLVYKVSGWIALTTTTPEIDATNLAGKYEKTVDISAWNDNTYQAFLGYSSGVVIRNSSCEFIVKGGILIESAPVTVATNNDKTGYALTSDYDAAKTAATQTSVDSISSHLIIRQKAISDVSPTTLKFDTTLTEANNDYWNNAAILFTSGVNLGVIRAIKDYDGVTKEITLNTALGTVPGNGDTFSIIMARAFRLVGLEAQEIRDAMKLDASAGAPASGSIDKHVDDIPTNPTLQTMWTDAKAGYLTGAVALNSTVAKEATLSNATYGLSALQVLLNAIATSSELQAMIDVIKGSGWTDETLKAIKDAIGSGGISEQQVRDAMKLAPTAGDPATGSVDKHLDDIISVAGTGARQVTVQLYLTATVTPIASVNIQIWNSTQTVLVASGISDTLGQKVFALNDATYKVRLSKIGSNFTVPETIIVSADSTKTLYGDTINIGTPSSVNTCRVYDYLYNPDDGTIPSTATIYAQIISLPYDYNGKIHAGTKITGAYNSTTGLIYWDLVYGATVEFTNTTYFGDSSITKVIPALTTKRFSEIE